MEQAISYIMQFYDVSREEAVKYYMDEIEAYMRLRDRFDSESA